MKDDEKAVLGAGLAIWAAAALIGCGVWGVIIWAVAKLVGWVTSQ